MKGRVEKVSVVGVVKGVDLALWACRRGKVSTSEIYREDAKDAKKGLVFLIKAELWI